MVEAFGMKVALELVLKNAKEIQKKVQDSMKNIPAGISEGAFGGGGGDTGAGGGFGKLLGKTALIAGTGLLILGAAKKMLGALSASSPILKGTLDILKRSMMIFFRPFGDFLASLLKPLAIVLMKAAVAWLQFWRKDRPKLDAGESALQRGRIVGGLPDKAAEELLDQLISGSKSWEDLLPEMKDRMFGWLIENAGAIKKLPLDIQGQILDWIEVNKAALVGLALKVNEAFSLYLLDPSGAEQLANLGPNIAAAFSASLMKNKGKLEGVVDEFVSWIKSLIRDRQFARIDFAEASRGTPEERFETIDKIRDIYDRAGET